MMQIRELILYGINGKVRRLPFKLGSVNIISGKSKSGKSAVGDIIDYCLGGSSCNIADGVIRENVAWYGLLLQFDNERVFVSRKNPDSGQQSTAYCYIEIGDRIEAPLNCNFISNENVTGLEETLSRRLGIAENINIPLDGKSRKHLSANIRHALYYCFQNQDEIAAKNFLFHRQSEDYITQAIKDTMPYFLGIVNEEALALENERTILKRQLAVEKRRVEEIRMLQGGGTQRAISLISEAKHVGLLDDNIMVDLDDYNSLHNILSSINEWIPIDIQAVGLDRLSYLQNQLDICQNELDELNEAIKNAKDFAGESGGFSDEAEHQKMRLSSIGLYEKLNFNLGYCPLCSSQIKNPLPNVEMIKTAIDNLDKNIQNVNRERPKLRNYIDQLEHGRQKEREKIQTIKSEIDGIFHQNEDTETIKDLNSRRAKVVGRISLWLESVENQDDASNKVEKIQNMELRLKEINELLGKDSLEEKRQSALTRMSLDMTNWAKELDLEHADNPYRLDMNKVTVIVDKSERPVPLKQLGSGSNWVGIHLITYLALQKYFIDANRPVPSFLFLDQPSQVYFPSELDEKKTDWKMVNALYDFIIQRTDDLKGKIQVIIVDHAELKDNNFRKLIIHNWWEDDNLVPKEWYENK